MQRRAVALTVAAAALAACAGASRIAAPKAAAPKAASPPGRAPVAVSAKASQPAAPDAGEPPLVFLGDIPVESPFGDALAAHLEQGGPLRLTLVPNASGASTWDEIAKRTKAKRTPAGGVIFEYDGYPSSPDAATSADRSASFVIDFDEPSVQAVRDQAKKAIPTPTMNALAKFVGEFIDEKDMQRGFDVASRVASHKEGDCTEHAVLLAALGRSFGFSTRVVLGVVLVVLQKRVMAFGHAWVEYAANGSWRPADAAIPPEVVARYIPLEVLRDEGPAFARRMLDATELVVLRAVRIDDVESAAQTRAPR